MKSGNAKLKDLFAKDCYTTGEAAELCQLSQQTIIRCFDGGLLGGFRVPGSKFRRIPRESLLKFMQEYNLAVANEMKKYCSKIFVLTDNDYFHQLVFKIIDARFDLYHAIDPFQAGIFFAQGMFPILDGGYSNYSAVQVLLDSLSRVERVGVKAIMVNNPRNLRITPDVLVIDHVSNLSDINEVLCID